MIGMMNWVIDFSPLVPWWVLGIFAALSFAVLVLTLIYRPRGFWLRGLSYLLLCLALANPLLISEERRALESVVAVIVDESESQTIGARAAETQQAAQAIVDEINAIDALSVRKTVVGSAGLSSREGTLAFQALKSALADVPPDQIAGALFITDGQIHDVPDPLDTVRESLGFDAPIHSLITGLEAERDRRVAIEKAPRFGIVGESDEVTIFATDDPGGGDTGPIPVVIKQDGREIGRELVRQGQNVTIPIDIDHAGDIYITVEAEELEGEITTLNNRAVTVVEGIRETLRVLLVSGEPHAGERTWRNLLKSDAAVDLVHFTILRPPDKQDGTPINQLSLIAFPTRELFSVKIDEFDLIIFDRYQRRGVLPRIYFHNIARYVENGGAVLVASGPDYADVGSLYYTPLAHVLSAEPTGRVFSDAFHPRVTEKGARHPVTRDLPGSQSTPPDWSAWYRLVQATVSAGDVVMDTPSGDPLLLLERIGEGRIAVLLSDHAWLWARGYQGGGPHLQLLRRLGHWLMKEPDLEEEAMTISVDGEDVVLERRSVSGDIGEAVLTRPSGISEGVSWREVEPGVWRATYEVDEIGLYQVSDASLTALGHVGPVESQEFIDFLSTTKRLEPIAAATGGRVQRLRASAVEEISVPSLSLIGPTTRYGGRGWLGLRRTDASVLEGLNSYSLFSGLFGLALLLGAVSLMWYREGR